MQVELHTDTDRALRQHAEQASPMEACGLLARGRDGTGRYLPMTNTDPTPAGFAMDPVEFARCERELREAGLEIFAFFHSHPQGPAAPSSADDESAWPGLVHLILGRGGELTAWYRDHAGETLRQIPAVVTAG